MTISIREKLMKFCVDNSVSEGSYEGLVSIVDEELNFLDKSNSEMRRSISDMERKYNKLEKFSTDAHFRFNSKVMSVYYLLDMVSKTGTHREKETVIMYMKCVLQDMIHKGDPLPLDEDALPF